MGGGYTRSTAGEAWENCGTWGGEEQAGTALFLTLETWSTSNQDNIAHPLNQGKTLGEQHLPRFAPLSHQLSAAWQFL